jgi:hypothetical protein
VAKLQLNSIVKYANKLGKDPVVVTQDMAEEVYQAINRAVFRSTLPMPKIIVGNYSKKGFWGECEGLQRGSRWGEHYTKCIRIEKHMPLKTLVRVMAHEMVHQWEWETHGVMTHGEKTFFIWKEDLLAKGIRLSIII